MSYIENNNVNYYLENEGDEFGEEENNIDNEINMDKNTIEDLKIARDIDDKNNNEKNNNFDTQEFQEKDNEKVLELEEENYKSVNKVEENKTTKKKLDFIPPSDDNINKYKRMFVFKNNTFSKVEIQGLLVEKKTFQKDDPQKSRHVLRLDDLTGTIQITCWRSKNDNLYLKIMNHLKCGMMLRVLGCVDQYRDTINIVVDNIEVVCTFSKEFIFHKSLKVNQNNLNNSKINEVMNIMNKNNTNEGIIYSNKQEVNKKVLTLSEKTKIHSHNRKNFANRILGFLKKFSLDDEIKEEMGYIIMKKDSLLNNQQFNQMKIDFCNDNKITNVDKFLMESLSLIEENSMGRIDHTNETIEIKLDDEINEHIVKMLKENPNGLSYLEIFDNISKLFNNFFMDDFIKFIIEELNNNGKIQQITPNNYQILN